jgi:hypothetical protein
LEKLDPRLIAKIDTTTSKGVDGQEAKFQVLIEHNDPIKLDNTGERDRQENIKELEHQVLQKLSAIISKLKHIRADQNFRVLPFANSVYAELTYDQIMEMSKLEDIKMIRLSTEDKVMMSL